MVVCVTVTLEAAKVVAPPFAAFFDSSIYRASRFKIYIFFENCREHLNIVYH